MIILLLNLIYLIMAETWVRTRRRLALLPPPSISGSFYPSVSVVVAVRNEEGNLESVLRDLIAQHYPGPAVEIIVVNDHSTDNTVSIVRAFGSEVRLLSLGEGEGVGKKAALTKGIQYATGDWILTTDADCRLPGRWIQTLVEAGEDRYADMVCGNIVVEGGEGFLHRFQEMESAVLQVMASASLALYHPLLNNAASLAFRREVWHEVGGYSGHAKIPSGDDTFLMLAMHRRRPGSVVPCVEQSARVRTVSSTGWKELFQQRLRWQSKVKQYRLGFIHLAGTLLWSSAAAIPIGCFLATIYPDIVGYLLASIVIRIAVEYRILALWRAATGQGFTVIQSVLMSLLYPIFLLVLLPAGIWMRSEWKGRRM